MGEDTAVGEDDTIFVSRLGELGIIFTILNALFTSSGLCLQKIVKKNEPNPNASLLRNPKYIAGISYVLIGLLLRGMIDMMLPQSTVAILSAQSVIATNIFEYFFLGGPLDANITVGLTITSLGIIFGSWGANTTDGIYSYEDLWYCFIRAETIIATGITVAALFSARQVLAFTSGGMQSLSGLIVTGIAAGLIAGWFGTAIKCLMEAIKYSFINGGNPFSPYHLSTWILIFSLFGLFSLKLKIVSFGLANYHHIQFLPVYQAAAIFFNSLYGIVFFQDLSTSHLHDLHAGANATLYIIGLVMTICGVASLTMRYNPDVHLLPSIEKDGYVGIEESKGLLGDDMLRGDQRTTARSKEYLYAGLEFDDDAPR